MRFGGLVSGHLLLDSSGLGLLLWVGHRRRHGLLSKGKLLRLLLLSGHFLIGLDQADRVDAHRGGEAADQL